jgi:uncharacterized repeat protein (TIGR01451 family)
MLINTKSNNEENESSVYTQKSNSQAKFSVNGKNDQNYLFDENALINSKRSVPKTNLDGVVKNLDNTNLDNTIIDLSPSFSNVSSFENSMESENFEIIESDDISKTQIVESKIVEGDNLLKFEVKKKFFETKIGLFLKKFWYLVTVLVILFLGVLFYVTTTYLESNKPAPTLSKIDIKIDGKDSVDKNAVNSWTVTVVNNDDYNIENLEVLINFDRDFKLNKTFGDFTEENGSKELQKKLKLPKLDKKTKKIQTIEGKFEANVDSDVKFSATSSFFVSDFKGKKNDLQNTPEVTKNIKVKSSSVRIDVNTLDGSNIAPSTTQTIVVTFANQSPTDIDNLNLKLEYKTNSSLVIYKKSVLTIPGREKEENTTTGNDTWKIATLKKGDTGELKVEIQINGQVGDKITINAKILDNSTGATINTSSRDLFILDRPLSVKAELITSSNDNMFKEGETLTYKIKIKNTSQNEIKNVEMVAKITEGVNLIDWNELKAESGSPIISKSAKSVTYTKDGTPSLAKFAAKAEENFTFTIKVKDISAFTNGIDKASNFFLVPILTVSSDQTDKITEPGEILHAISGPTVEQTVEYTSGKKQVKVTWTVKNKFSPVTDFKMRARTTLPVSSFDQSSFSNKNTLKVTNDNYIIWDPGTITEYAGYSNREPFKVSFIINNTSDGNGQYLETAEYSGNDSENNLIKYNQNNFPIMGQNNVPFKQP